ncbi:MAG: hypothetical protein ACRECP_08170 [Methylocella sp.]
MRLRHMAVAAPMLSAFLASGAPAGATLTANRQVFNALTGNARGTKLATAFRGARVIAVEFAPKAQ